LTWGIAVHSNRLTILASLAHVGCISTSRFNWISINLPQRLLNIHIVFCNIVRDRDHIAWVATYGIAELFALVSIMEVLTLKLLLNEEKIVFQVLQRVGLEVGKVSDVILVFKLIAEAQSVQGNHLRLNVFIFVAWYVVFIEFVIRSTFSDFGPALVLVVADVFTTSLPLVGAMLLVPSGRVYKRLHAYLVA